MKHLTVIYNDHTLFDSEINELVWSDSDSGIKIEGRRKQRSSGGGAGGLLDMLASVSKSRTSEMVAEKRQQLQAEQVAAEV